MIFINSKNEDFAYSGRSYNVHPAVGILDYEVSNFEVSGYYCLKLIVHTPLSGTDTELKMKNYMES